MKKKNSISVSDDIISNLQILADEKESVRRKLEITASKLATMAKEKESVRRKLLVTAKEKESVRRKLLVTAKEKESVRRRLAITAKKLALTAAKLAVTASKLKVSYETLEKKVLDRTQSLEMSRVKEEAILLSIGDGLIVTDERGIVTIMNRTAEKMLGRKSKEVVGKFFSENTSLTDERGVLIPLDKHPISMALKTGVTTNSTALGSYYHTRKDKTQFPVSITATPVILDGKVIGTIKVFRDITSEREIDKAKTEFVSLASHQLRTPLSAVNWYAEMLLAGDAGEMNETQKKYMDEVYKSNQRMVELVNALLDVASLELGTFAIEPAHINIGELAVSVIDEQRSQINSKKLSLSYSCPKNIPLMRADPKLMRMVMQNLLSNAVKYTPVSGKIDFSIALLNEREIILKVSDTGYGIPKNQKDKIFTKLFRADNVRDKDTDGTGLGLYIVKSIVQNSGGKIWFISPGEKRKIGTTFFVTLPFSGRNPLVKNTLISK